MNFNAFLITLISGLSFYIGYFIVRLFNDKKKLITFSIGFAFSILIGLIIFDLIPECLEMFDKWYIIVIYIISGILILKALDLLIPSHHHTESNNHIEHIGFVSFIAILLHNIIESFAIYSTSISEVKLGVLMAIGVSCHNIPFGIQITSLTKNNKKSLIMTSILALSSIIGILILGVFDLVLPETVISALVCITLGMLIYIVFFELLCEVREHIKTKEMFYGLFFGILVIFLAMVI